MRDLNDVLREEGDAAVLKVFDCAKVFNSKYTAAEVEQAIRTLPTGWMNVTNTRIQSDAEYWQGTLGPGTAMLVGPSSAGKTTLSCGLGYAFATGRSFFGRQIIEPMGVAHVLGEGITGISRRYNAIRIHTGDVDALPIAWRQNKGCLFNQKVRKSLISDLGELGAYYQAEFGVPLRVVFLDTARSNWQFKEENSNSEWAIVVQHLQQFADAINGVAIATHHPPKSGIGESGGGAARAGLDYILTASCDRNDETGEVKNRKLALTKHRDGETGIISAFEVRKVALGILDAFGQEITSIVAIPSDAPHSAANAKADNDTIITFRRAFDEAISVAGREHKVMESGDVKSPVVMAAPVGIVRQEFYKRYATGDEDEKKAQQNRKKAFQRALKVLINRYGREVLDGEELIWRL